MGPLQSPYGEGLHGAPLYKGLHYGDFVKPLQSSYREGLCYGGFANLEFLHISGNNMPPEAFALVLCNTCFI